MADIKHLFVVGAGFSAHAGLPLTADFTKELLKVESYSETAPSKRLVEFLRRFVSEAFDHSATADARFWPHLEDVFTSVDLAANTGHHLGPKYSPSDLRTVRRALIVRTIRMLKQAYDGGSEARGSDWKQLMRFLKRVDLDKCAFLSMNWDTVVESGLHRKQHAEAFDYMCDARAARFDDKGNLQLADSADPDATLIKMHGSSNWLYCDVCRTTFWVEPSMTLDVANLLFQDRDWKILCRIMGSEKNEDDAVEPTLCPTCDAPAIGTRFATFSYRKALDFPMYERSWLAAETLLRQAKTWTFIGYSLPAADYQFKHLLKHVELSRQKAPEMILVSGGEGAGSTLKNYQRFFGPKISRKHDTYFEDGIDEEALDRLEKAGALT